MNNFFKKYWKKFKTICKKHYIIKYAAIAVPTILSIVFLKKIMKSSNISVKLSYFVLGLKKDMIKEVFISGSSIYFLGKNSNQWFKTNGSLLSQDRLYKLLSEKLPNLHFSCVEGAQQNDPQFIALLSILGCVSFFAGQKAYDYFNKENIGKQNYKQITNFEDVYGHEHAKTQLKEIIDFLNDPEKFTQIGARLRRGVLLYGPSGTGKTLLARATAGESKSSFFHCPASEFIELYVGMGAKKVRMLFEKARKNAPSIIFIDEIDGIGTKRKEGQFAGGEEGSDQERSTTLNQLLTEMDGFDNNQNIVVIAATNRMLMLDNALIRSGRFDTKLKIDMPNEEERNGIMKVHLRKKVHAITDQQLELIASKTIGFSGADLESMINESAYFTVSEELTEIQDRHLENAFNRAILNKKN